MKYLKYFEQASAYEAYKNGSDYVTPNVSYVVETKGVSFEPYVPIPTIYATFLVSNSNNMMCQMNNVKRLKINNEVITFNPEIETYYFDASQIGECAVEIELKNGVTNITQMFNNSCVKSLKFPESVSRVSIAYCSQLESIELPESTKNIYLEYIDNSYIEIICNGTILPSINTWECGFNQKVLKKRPNAIGYVSYDWSIEEFGEPVVIKEFTINGDTFQFIDGMTWESWLGTSLNKGIDGTIWCYGFSLEESGVISRSWYDGETWVKTEYLNVNLQDKIIENFAYSAI